ncbi:MAG: EAL domain-containing protein [Eubacterium sp.]|nr:EAL domain-containing protein [Eubacterium sp.]
MFDYSFGLGVAVASLLICLVNLIYTFIQGRTDKLQNKIFISILAILMINSVTGIITGVYGANPDLSEHSAFALQASRYAYFVTHTALCPLFFYYVSSISFMSTRLNSVKMGLISAPFFVTEILAITNPSTHFVWSFIDDVTFKREWGEFAIYVAALFYYILAFVVLIRTWNFISGKRKTALIFFFVLVAVGVLIQLIDKNMKVEVLAEAVGFTGVLMAVENEDDRTDFGMGFYNRAALNLDIGSCLKHNRKLSVLVIRINNYDLVNRLVGNGEINVISDIISDYLKTVVRRYYIYVPEKQIFVLTIYNKTPEQVEKLAEDITKRFETPWDYKDFSVQLSVTVMVADIPGQVKTTSEVFYMIDSPIPSDKDKAVLIGDDLNFIIRRKMIEDALPRGFSENSYEVYYQPTFYLNGKLHGAEALIRMHDKEIGNIYPDEFIPIAEQNGLVDDIDDFVLENVCEFLKSGIPQENGIDNINVNLSVLQCMRPHFVDNINEIVERYGIEKNLINFEITETIAASDYDALSNVIQKLKEEGFMFSMDDYGTGYSNVSAIFSMNLDVVKIDKSLLWGAETSELGMIILENTIRMIRQMKKKILVEGVETRAHIELLTRLGVDYLQGFYFSKPIPKDHFVKYISAIRKKNMKSQNK